MIRCKTLRLHPCILLMVLFMGWADARSQTIQPPSVESPVGLRQVTVIPNLSRQGLNGIGIAYQLSGSQPSPDVANLWASLQTWSLTCRLYDENRFPLPATQGTRRFSRNGLCMDSIVLTGKALEAAYNGDTLFYPYHAIGTEPGRQRIQAVLVLRDLKGQRPAVRSESAVEMVSKPPMRMVRLQLERMQAKTTNTNGETWDYKFFNPKDVFPDLHWNLRRGAEWVFEGEKQKNDTLYTGTAADLTTWFFISQGDKLQLQVNDFDLLGASDLIGQTEIDIDQGSYAAGVSYDFVFGQMASVKLKIDAILPPKVAVTGLEVVEGDREQGVSGMRVRLNYDQETRNRSCEFLIALAYVTPDGVFDLGIPRIVGPGAIPVEDGTVLLTAARSPLELFVPAYAMAGFPDASRQRMRLILTTKIDGQTLVVGTLDRQLTELRSPIQDMAFGQWKIGVQDQAGEGGIRMSIDYELPEGYFQGLPDAKLGLVPKLAAPWGEVANAEFVVMGPGKADWQGGQLRLNSQNRKGTLDLFLPFHHCGLSAGKPKFAISYIGTLSRQGDVISLGDKGLDVDLEMPALRELHFSVREVAVSRRRWLLADPNLFWVLKVGATEVYRSPVKASTRDAKWADEIETKLVTAATDRITLEIVHKGLIGEPDKVVESWSVAAADIPDKPKGNTRIDAAAVKRLTIHSFWLE